MCRAVFVRLVGKQRRVDPAEHDPRAEFLGLSADLITAPRIPGMNTDADDVAGCDGGEVDLIERFIDQARITPFGPRCRGQHVQPPRRDDRHAERDVTRIDQMYFRAHSHLSAVD